DLQPDVADRPGARPLGRVAGEVHFDNVSFSYQAAEAGGAVLPEVVRWRRGATVSLAESGAARNGAPPSDGARGKDAADTLAPADGEAAVPAAERRWALRDVTFTVRPGQLAALVGPSGAGKTTITYLLPRLYDPTAGQILLDGHDLRDVTLDSLTANIGMVTQEPYLFHDTIRAHLLYARPAATQAELDAACQAANV